MESNDSLEIPDRGETSDIPGLPSGEKKKKKKKKNGGEKKAVPVFFGGLDAPFMHCIGTSHSSKS